MPEHTCEVWESCFPTNAPRLTKYTNQNHYKYISTYCYVTTCYSWFRLLICISHGRLFRFGSFWPCAGRWGGACSEQQMQEADLLVHFEHSIILRERDYVALSVCWLAKLQSAKSTATHLPWVEKWVGREVIDLTTYSSWCATATAWQCGPFFRR